MRPGGFSPRSDAQFMTRTHCRACFNEAGGILPPEWRQAHPALAYLANALQ